MVAEAKNADVEGLKGTFYFRNYYLNQKPARASLVRQEVGLILRDGLDDFAGTLLRSGLGKCLVRMITDRVVGFESKKRTSYRQL